MIDSSHQIWRISSAMMTRLMLNLRDTETPENGPSCVLSDLVFARSRRDSTDNDRYDDEDHGGNELPLHRKDVRQLDSEVQEIDSNERCSICEALKKIRIIEGDIV